MNGASLVLLALVPAIRGAAQVPERLDTSSVLVTSGIGTIKLTPDHAVITVSVSTRDSSAAAASLKNGVRLHRVLDSLKAIRQPAESVQVVGLSVRPNEDRERARVVDYEAAAIIRITLRSLDRVGTILDVGLRSGATEVQDIEYHSDREEAARDDALAQAYARARSSALALTKAAGITLGPLVRLSTEPDEGLNRFAFAAEAVNVGGWGSVAVAPKDIEVTARVAATWRLAPLRSSH
jgi:uncharacterized protein YggE